MNHPTATPYWHIPRPGLAATYLSQIKIDEGYALGLYAPPGSGLSAFLRYDLVPCAQRADMETVYVDMRDRVDAVDATLAGLLLHALTDEELSFNPNFKSQPIPRRRASDVGEHPVVPRLLEVLVGRPAHRPPLVLIVDQCEHLCLTTQAINEWDHLLFRLGAFHAHLRLIVCATTRGSFALLQQAARRGDGSGRKGIAVMAPRELPPPELDFVQQCANKYLQATSKQVRVEEIKQAFDALDRRPGRLTEVLAEAIAAGLTNVTQAARTRVDRLAENPYPLLAWRSLSAVESAVLLRVFEGKELFSKAALLELKRTPGVSKLTNGALVQRAINALMRLGIIYPTGRAIYELESLDYEQILRENGSG